MGSSDILKIKEEDPYTFYEEWRIVKFLCNNIVWGYNFFIKCLIH